MWCLFKIEIDVGIHSKPHLVIKFAVSHECVRLCFVPSHDMYCMAFFKKNTTGCKLLRTFYIEENYDHLCRRPFFGETIRNKYSRFNAKSPSS